MEYSKFSDLLKQYIEPILNTLNEYPKLNNYLIDYFFITIVKLIDNYCRNIIIKTIDENNLDIGKLFEKGEFTTTVNIIDEIKKKEFTKGRLVASNFNFQNIDDILFVFSKLLNINILEALKELGNEPFLLKTSSLKKHLDGLNNDWDQFLDFFEMRNQVAHSLQPLDYEKFDENFFPIWTIRISVFLVALTKITKWYLFIKHGNSPSKKQLNTFLFYKNLIKKYTLS